MAKSFRPWDVDQAVLFPPTLRDLVPEGHVAHFVRDVVREQLELSEIYAAYTEERGLMWSLACTAHNLLKLAAAKTAPAR